MSTLWGAKGCLVLTVRLIDVVHCWNLCYDFTLWNSRMTESWENWMSFKSTLIVYITFSFFAMLPPLNGNLMFKENGDLNWQVSVSTRIIVLNHYMLTTQSRYICNCLVQNTIHSTSRALFILSAEQPQIAFLGFQLSMLCTAGPYRFMIFIFFYCAPSLL
jgi:hypothetical protein